MKESSVFKKIKCEAIIAALDSGVLPGRLKFYTGPQPSTADTPVTSQSLVCECVLQKPSGWYDTHNNQLVLYPPNVASILLTTDIVWARMEDGYGRAMLDFTVGDVSYDPLWSSVILALRMNGTDGSTTFVNSANPTVACIAGGNAVLSTAQKKFGTASGYFDGSGGYVDVPIQSAIGTGDYTMEAWVYPTAVTGTYHTIFNFGEGTMGLYRKANQFLLYEGGDYCASSIITANSWYHVSLVRQSGIVKLYVNGVATATSTTSSMNISTTTPRIGSGASGSESWLGYIDDARITKAARYSGNFTPSAVEIPISSSQGELSLESRSVTAGRILKFNYIRIT